VAFCRLFPDNQLEAKHVESDFADCLDPGSTPGSSTELNKTVQPFGCAVLFFPPDIRKQVTLSRSIIGKSRITYVSFLHVILS
jgi:hypothetical protein